MPLSGGSASRPREVNESDREGLPGETMSKTKLIVVADATRARFFTIEGAEPGSSVAGPWLIERSDLTNPEVRARGMEASSDPVNRKRRPTQSSAHGYPDHRPGQTREKRQQFARRILAVAAEYIKRNPVSDLILFAPTQMLSELRKSAAGFLPSDVQQHTFAEELSWHSAPSILAALMRHNLFPSPRQGDRGRHWPAPVQLNEHSPEGKST